MEMFMGYSQAINQTEDYMLTRASKVHPPRWQGIDVSDKPEMLMYEYLNHSFTVVNTHPLTQNELAVTLRPNMPWAENHFLERVAGEPLNPGVEWANWPFAASADRFRTENQKFTHTYMERYWPKWAAREKSMPVRTGIRYKYGDLEDVIQLMARDPLGRQAYLPVWFPEDTGVAHGGRVPCTLGYWFLRRGDALYTTYYIRSCDFIRHFRDDIYLTHRLADHILERLVAIDPEKWSKVQNAVFVMHIGSLHMFVNDRANLLKAKDKV